MANLPWGPTNQVTSIDPADDNRYIGAAFRHQTITGVMRTDPANDRVDFVAGEDGRPVEQITHGLGADVPSTGVEAADFGTGVTGTTFPRLYGEEPFPHNPDPGLVDMYQGTAAVVPSQKSWYDTLRPYAGFPLPGTNDNEYALLTDETEPIVRAEYPGVTLTYIDRTLQLPDRRVKDIPDKAPRQPASPNDERPWDIIMGAWPWTGDKAAMQQPVASMPRFYAEGIPGGIPSPGGTQPTVPNTVDLTPYPLTWRLSASPFDTGQAGYMDAGTAASSG